MISRYSSIYVGAEKMSVVTLYQREFSHFVEAKPVWIFKKIGKKALSKCKKIIRRFSRKLVNF